MVRGSSLTETLRVPGSLRFRVLLVIALATLPALVFILYTASQTREQSRRKIEAQARYLARLASRQHAGQISAARALLSAIRGIPFAWRERPTPCPEFFPALLRSVPHLANLGILSVDGHVTCSVVPSPEHLDMSATPAFQRALTSRAVEVGEYRIGLIVRRPVLVLAYAIREPGGAVQEVSFAALDSRLAGRAGRRNRDAGGQRVHDRGRAGPDPGALARCSAQAGCAGRCSPGGRPRRAP